MGKMSRGGPPPPPPPLKPEHELEAPLKIRHLRLVVLFDAAEMLGIHS